MAGPTKERDREVTAQFRASFWGSTYQTETKKGRWNRKNTTKA